MADPISASSKQIAWLIKQQKIKIGLVDSYEGDGTDNAYLYDQALAIMAFVRAGEHQKAKKIISALKLLQNRDGSWNNCYSAKTGESCDHSVFTGSIAWAILSINYYQKIAGDKSFSLVSGKALAWMETMGNIDSTKEYYGSLKFGKNYEKTKIGTESNISVWAAYSSGAKLAKTNEDNYTALEYEVRAALIKKYLFSRVWNSFPRSDGSKKDFNVFREGYNDLGWVTDAQSWGVLAFGKTASEALGWLETGGYGNGSTKTIQDFGPAIKEVKGFGFTTADRTLCGATPVWTEGTEGVVAAFKAIGDSEISAGYHQQIKRLVSEKGGIPYSFVSNYKNGKINYPCNYRYNSVAGTAWYYFNETGFNPLGFF